MNSDVKQKWVAALRSGEFEQCTGALRMGDSYCCLGVLSELAVRDGVISPAEALPADDWRSSRGNGKPVYTYDNETGSLPPEVSKWAGLMSPDVWNEYDDANPIPDEDPYVDGEPVSLINDAGTTFAEIADLIEKEL